jgi:hypothetical protein
MAILQRLLYLSDVPSLYRRVCDLCQVFAVVSSSVVLFGPPVATSGQLAAAQAELERSFGQRRNANQDRLCASLFRSFRPNAHHRVQNGPAALRRLYAISQYCHGGFWKRGAVRRRMPQSRFATIVHIINIARLLPSPKRWSL